MTVEDPHVSPHDPRRRMYADLAGQMPDDPYVVVAEDELDRQPLTEELGEEVEDHRPKRRRGPYDRVLRVPRDDHRLCPCGARYPDEVFGEAVGRGLGWAERTLGRAAEAEVDVRDDERPLFGPPDRFDDQRGRVRHRV